MGMWTLFAASFRKNLTSVFGLDEAAAQAVTKKAKGRYKEIIADLPEFEKADRFKMNIVNCAMLGAFVLSMPKRPDVQKLTTYYERARMTPACLWLRVCSLQGPICAGCFMRLLAGTGGRRRKSLLLGQACLSLLMSCIRHWLSSTRSEAFWREMQQQMVM